MKTFRKRAKEAHGKKMSNFRKRKEELRIERNSCEPVRAEWRGVHEHTITFCNRITGEMHSVDLFRGRRRDQYRAEVDGVPWRTINATQLGKLVRQKFKPHIKED